MHSDTWPAWRSRESLIVQKYSGSSIADHSGIQRVAQRIVDTQRAGFSVVVVLPEVDGATDELLALAAEVAPLRPSRELDGISSRRELFSVGLLVIAMTSLGAAPHVFPGGEAGLVVRGINRKGHTVEVNPEPLLASLALREIPIVTGIQGTSRGAKEVRGPGPDGSDLMAVALAASLNAGVCEIYSEFDGLFAADHHIVPRTRKVHAISRAPMQGLAAGGAKTLHRRCLEYARRLGVTIHVRSTYSQPEGTLAISGVGEGAGAEHAATLEEAMISGVTLDRSHMQVTVAGVPAGSRAAARIFGLTAAAGACADMITQGIGAVDNCMDISFILPVAQYSLVAAALSSAQETIGFQSWKCDEVGKISLTGFGLRADPSVLCRLLGVLSEAGIKVRLLSNSAVSISVVIDPEMLDVGINAIRKEFDQPDGSDERHVEKYVNNPRVSKTADSHSYQNSANRL